MKIDPSFSIENFVQTQVRKEYREDMRVWLQEKRVDIALAVVEGTDHPTRDEFSQLLELFESDEEVMPFFCSVEVDWVTGFMSSNAYEYAHSFFKESQFKVEPDVQELAQEIMQKKLWNQVFWTDNGIRVKAFNFFLQGDKVNESTTHHLNPHGF